MLIYIISNLGGNLNSLVDWQSTWNAGQITDTWWVWKIIDPSLMIYVYPNPKKKERGGKSWFNQEEPKEKSIYEKGVP